VIAGPTTEPRLVLPVERLDGDGGGVHATTAGVLPCVTASVLGCALWGSFRAHNLWPYETLYREGNERVRRFLRPGGFVPLEVRWRVTKELPCLNA
jgi:hypothetical protein